ncbi:hypothetical protein N9V84_08355, partial [Verrucomicrobiales bacterium]|nr:hypothetical protein [Verrucomicrobiales bacterium]
MRTEPLERHSVVDDNQQNKPAATVAVVGMGYWGRNLVRAYHQLGGLHTVCDSNTAIEAELAKACPGVKFVRDYPAVLADPAIRAIALAEPPPIPSNEANLTPWTKSNFLAVTPWTKSNFLAVSLLSARL